MYCAPANEIIIMIEDDGRETYAFKQNSGNPDYGEKWSGRSRGVNS
jgi:hypothetical protein